MEKIHSKLRRTDYYDFGHGLTLMNVLSKTEEGNVWLISSVTLMLLMENYLLENL